MIEKAIQNIVGIGKNAGNQQGFQQQIRLFLPYVMKKFCCMQFELVQNLLIGKGFNTDQSMYYVYYFRYQ